MRFELTRSETIGLAVQRLNHSATLSKPSLLISYINPRIALTYTFKRIILKVDKYSLYIPIEISSFFEIMCSYLRSIVLKIDDYYLLVRMHFLPLLIFCVLQAKLRFLQERD